MCYCLFKICYNKNVGRLLPLIFITSPLCVSSKRWADMVPYKNLFFSSAMNTYIYSSSICVFILYTICLKIHAGMRQYACVMCTHKPTTLKSHEKIHSTFGSSHAGTAVYWEDFRYLQLCNTGHCLSVSKTLYCISGINLLFICLCHIHS